VCASPSVCTRLASAPALGESRPRLPTNTNRVADKLRIRRRVTAQQASTVTASRRSKNSHGVTAQQAHTSETHLVSSARDALHVLRLTGPGESLL
jgi:hypothetical protein